MVTSPRLKRLHPSFVAEIEGVDVADSADESSLGFIRAALDEHAVVVLRDQNLNNDDHLAFSRRLDGELHSKTGSRTIAKNRFGDEALTDISNIDAGAPDGHTVLASDDRRRLYSLANRLWHTDASFEYPPGRYSLLYAHVVPPISADTEFADMRGAYDALGDDKKTHLDGLMVHHSIAYSRQTLGFEFSDAEAKQLEGAVHPLIREFPGGRRGLYLASHAASIEGMALPEARLLLKELIEHATQKEYVYRHPWRQRDLVIYDNRATMHRATAYDDQSHVRDLRRVTTLEIPPPVQSRRWHQPEK